MPVEHAPLPPEDLCRRCDATQFEFKTTDDLTDGDGVIGQERAIEAIAFALGMSSPGYNLYAAGPRGIGKHRLVTKLVSAAAAERPAGRDWCYVYNFEDARNPDALSLPAGKGAHFQDAMEQLVRDLRSALTSAFSGEDYRNSLQSIQDEVEQHQGEALETLRKQAEQKGITLLNTPMGYGFAPVQDGQVMVPEAFNQLPQEEKTRIEADIKALQEELKAVMQKLPALLQKVREQIRALNEETAEFAIGGLIDGVKNRFAEQEEITTYLGLVHDDVKSNIELFLAAQQPPGQGADGPNATAMRDGATDSFFRRYQVNLIVDNGGCDSAPVVYEDEPTYERLIGRIEQRVQMGALTTDFNMIRGGALHRANGGYLILDARKVLTQPLAWEGLKRAIWAKEIRIEPLYGALGLPSTNSLEPEAIPLETKIILVGDGMIYYLLQANDPDYGSLFKVLADFDERVIRTGDASLDLAKLTAKLAREASLRPFNAEAVGRLIDDLARAASDSERLSTNVERLEELMHEADYLAGKADAPVVTGDHIKQAINARTRRASRIPERMRSEIIRETVLIDTDGTKVGQINGLAVYSMGTNAFGRPSRISARVRIGRGNVVDIEREVALGGPLHSKGVLILSGYLGARYAPNTPLSLSASLVFEQSYGGVDGDSASSTELYALLSALAEVPIYQHFAVTGSVNQRGEVQAIGGVNEKIEGFFDLCAERGLTGQQGVLIPDSNAKHLMLHPRVVDAARAGQFHIHAVKTIDQGIEILTGMEAGELGSDGNFPDGTLNARVAARLRELAEHRRDFSRPGGDGGDS
ncbi:MAG: Lon protease family protein [Alphaproteobacteria bacterium]